MPLAYEQVMDPGLDNKGNCACQPGPVMIHQYAGAADQDYSMPEKKAYRILTIADNDRAIPELEAMLGDEPAATFNFTPGKPDELSRVLLGNDTFDVAVLDLDHCYTPDLAVIPELHEHSPGLPLVVLNQQADVDYSILALRKGAQDYLDKRHCNSAHLLHAIRYAMERARYLRKIAESSTYEPLTGLANRLLLDDRLEQAIERASRNRTGIAVLYIDLDNFRRTDEQLGRRRSDKLLRQTADRIRNCLRGSDTIARVGGDEFVVLLESANHAHGACSVAGKVISALSRHMVTDGKAVVTGCSIGISLFPQCGRNINDLIYKAELARCRAYAEGGSRYCFYTDNMDTEFIHVMNLENELANALERKEFCLHYQPRFNLNNGRVCGSEALLRWNHPRLGLLLPEDFMHYLENRSSVHEIGEWILESACETSKRWHQSGLCVGPMSVNITARQLLDRTFFDTVERVLDKTGLPSCLLELAVTEQTLINNEEVCSRQLQALRKIGVSISVDDFGTGHCSFDYLRNFLVDTIKLDRSLIEHIGQRSTDSTITTAIVRLARDLHVNVVADGVDNIDQFKLLFDMAVDGIQGNFLSPAMPATSLRNYLLTNGLELNLMFEPDLKMAV